jgi:predicted GNAT family acetyltransferase
MTAAHDGAQPGVRHDAAARRFWVEIDGRTAVLDYEGAPGVLAFTHTFVPAELRGRGLAERLVRAGLAHARETRNQVRPDCSYVAAFMAKHAEFRDLIA